MLLTELPTELLLSILDCIIPPGSSYIEIQQGQHCFNAIALTSSRSASLARRARFTRFVLPTGKSVDLLLDRAHSETRGLIRKHLRAITFGGLVDAGGALASDEPFARFLAVLGETNVVEVIAQGVRVSASFLWTIRRSEQLLKRIAVRSHDD